MKGIIVTWCTKWLVGSWPYLAHTFRRLCIYIKNYSIALLYILPYISLGRIPDFGVCSLHISFLRRLLIQHRTESPVAILLNSNTTHIYGVFTNLLNCYCLISEIGVTFLAKSLTFRSCTIFSQFNVYVCMFINTDRKICHVDQS